MDGIIEMRGFSFIHRGSDHPAVEGANLVIREGSLTGIVGPAGSGKTTLVDSMCGVIPHCISGDFYGTVLVDGKDVCEVPLTEVARCVGSVRQDVDSQFVASEVEDELLYGLENFGFPRDEIAQRVEDVLADMGIADLRHRGIATLSGGQKQKVAIAAMLALSPRVLVLDEPTAELDPASSASVFALLSRYARSHGTTVVVVEQKIDLLARFADRLVVMDEGRIRFDDVPARVLEHDRVLDALGVGCPRATVLVNRLRTAGVVAADAVRTVEEACTVLKGVLA